MKLFHSQKWEILTVSHNLTYKGYRNIKLIQPSLCKEFTAHTHTMAKGPSNKNFCHSTSFFHTMRRQKNEEKWTFDDLRGVFTAGGIFLCDLCELQCLIDV